MNEPVELGQMIPGQPVTFTPTYDPPGLSIRAEFLATDGSRPQEIVLEWRHDPGQELTLLILEKLAEIAAPAQVITRVDRAPGVDPIEQVPDNLDLNETYSMPRPYCGEVGPGHDEQGHGCSLYAGHEPVEPQGRAHRCRCGGIFGTEQEHPAVPGRRERDRDRRR